MQSACGINSGQGIIDRKDTKKEKDPFQVNPLHKQKSFCP
jgi:hypothetical protein